MQLLRQYPDKTAILVFVLAFCVMLAVMVRDINMFDEGIILVGAMRTLAGDIPHRDYYSIYGPGQYYAVAFLFALFGKSLLVARIYSLLVMSGIVAAVFAITIRRLDPVFSLVATGFCAAFIIASPYHLYPVFPVMLLAMIGTAILLAGDARPTWGRAALAGGCAGLAALFRYDSGFFILVAHCIAMVMLAPASGVLPRIKAAVVPVVAYGFASALVFGPFAISYLMVADLSHFLADIIEYPVTYYAAMRGLPFPGPWTLIEQPAEIGVYFPVLAAAAAIWALAKTRPGSGNQAADDRHHPLIVMTLALTVVLFYKGMVRVSSLHMLMSIIPATILVSVVAERLWQRRHRAAVAVLLVAAAIAPLAPLAREARDDIRSLDRTLVGWAMGAGRTDSPCAEETRRMPVRFGEDYLRVAKYLRAYSASDERIFVGLNRHDRIFVNPIALYFAADRLPATHWHQFDPGLQTRADIQRKIIADLDAENVRWVVRDASFDAIREPNDSARSSGVFLLDQFIDDRYRPVARAGEIEIWLAKGDGFPQGAEAGECAAVPTVN